MSTKNATQTPATPAQKTATKKATPTKAAANAKPPAAAQDGSEKVAIDPSTFEYPVYRKGTDGGYVRMENTTVATVSGKIDGNSPCLIHVVNLSIEKSIEILQFEEITREEFENEAREVLTFFTNNLV